MSVTTIAATEESGHAERWRLWQLAYAESSRKAATQMRILLTVVLTALAIALGLQLFST
jgi:hypothetical protein